MEIVIENPGESSARSHLTPTPDYFPGLSNQRLQLTGAEMNGSATIRRVDRSGLLEMPVVSQQRHLTGAEMALSVDHDATPRRVDRSGLLEPLANVSNQPLVAQMNARALDQSDHDGDGPRSLTGVGERRSIDPDGTSPKNETPTSPGKRCLATASPLESTFSTESTVARGRCTPGLMPDEMQQTLTRSRERRGSYTFRSMGSPQIVPLQESTDAPKDNHHPSSANPANRGETQLLDEPANCRGHNACSDTTFAKHLNETSRQVEQLSRLSPTRTPTPSESSERLKLKPEGILGRLSPRLRSDRVSSPVALSIPDVIEAHEPQSNNARTNSDESAPEGERAEAEGCEHTAIESLEESRVSFKAPNKILRKDNIQTLRVIILSEQL